MHPLENILGNAGDGICFMTCPNLRTGKIHTPKSDVHTVVPMPLVISFGYGE